MQDEISLREIIETIYKGKVIIATITAVAVIISILYSFFYLSPVFEANSTVRIGNGTDEEHKIDISTFAETLTTDVAIRRIAKKLQLEEDDAIFSSIRSSIRTELVPNANVLRIFVSGGDIDFITNVANQLAFDLGTRIEISERSEKIVDFQKQLQDKEATIQITKSELEEAVAQLKNTPEKFVTNQSLANQPFLQSIIGQALGSLDTEIGTLLLESEVVNPAYTELQARVAATSIALTKLEAEANNIEQEIESNLTRITELEQQVFNEKLRAVNSERLLNGFNAIYISPAIEPSIPIGPNKMLNVAIALVVGLVLSTMIVFVRRYWGNTARQKTV